MGRKDATTQRRKVVHFASLRPCVVPSMASPPRSIPHRPIGIDEGGTPLLLAQSQLEHAIVALEPEGAVGGDAGAKVPKPSATGSGQDLNDPGGGVDRPERGERLESLVVVVVSGEDQVGTAVVEHPPDPGEPGIPAVPAGAVAGMVEVGHRALLAGPLEVFPQPFLLVGLLLGADVPVD